MRSTRYIALLLAVLTLLTLLVACGNRTTEAPKTETPETAAPTTETSVTETPTETPVTETPTETPVTETPTEMPVTPTPTETPTTETPVVTETPVPVKADPAEILKGKKLGFFGDSIVHASTHDTAYKETYKERYGWPGRIGTENEAALWDNNGQDGASVSTIRGSNTVFNQLRNYRSRKYDFVVLEGGVNDAWDNCKLGTLSDTPVEEFDPKSVDRSTFAGGLEHMLYYAKYYYPKATILYVFNFKMGSNQGSLMKMRGYIDLTIAACEKWDIPYLNLYDDAEFNETFAITTKTNAVDGIHPNSAGYDLLAPVIAQAMADAYVAKNAQ